VSPALQQRAWAALMLALISLVGLMLLSSNARRGIVVLAVTLVIGAVGLWLAITTMSRSRRAGGARPRFVVLATVLAVAGTGFSAVALLGFALFWPQISQYENCMAGANTVAAQNACSQQLNNSLQGSVHLLGH
jgi:hypothetical protein